MPRFLSFLFAILILGVIIHLFLKAFGLGKVMPKIGGSVVSGIFSAIGELIRLIFQGLGILIRAPFEGLWRVFFPPQPPVQQPPPNRHRRPRRP